LKTPHGEQCAYCGSIAVVTRDHIPPKLIFSKPRPNNLITVPACPTCHSTTTSKDDEYFRLALQVRDGIADHPDVVKTRRTLLRSLQKPEKAGMAKGLLQKIRLAEFVTPSGIFIKKQLALETDMSRIRRVVQRTMRGLFYFHKQHRLPEGYDALICDEDNFRSWPANVTTEIENMLTAILAQRLASIGNGVFSYGFGVDKINPDMTCWVFIFYETIRFIGLTLPPIPQAQRQ
jgi:hypothetical protein